MRIVCDDYLRIPAASRLVQTAKDQPLITACLPGADRETMKLLEEKGVIIWEIPEKNGRIDLSCLMEKLGENKIDGILLEGGGTSTRVRCRQELSPGYIVIWRRRYSAGQRPGRRWKAGASVWRRKPGSCRRSICAGSARIFFWNTT